LICFNKGYHTDNSIDDGLEFRSNEQM